MKRTLLTTTAITLSLVVAPVTATWAQQPPAPMTTPPVEAPAVKAVEGELASRLIGESIYDGTGAEAKSIGKVTDLIIDNGEVVAVVVGVGGFLGIGEKEVALNYEELQWIMDEDGKRRAVMATTEEALKEQLAFDRSAYRDDAASAGAGTTGDSGGNLGMPATPGIAVAPQNNDAPPATDAPAPMTPDIAPTEPTQEMPAQEGVNEDASFADRSSLVATPVDALSVDKLVGSEVHGYDDVKIGDVSDVILSAEGQVEAVILDVGGFLGIGEKPVAVALEGLDVMSDDAGRLYVFTPFTKEQLEAQPDYDEAQYIDHRNEMLLRAP